MMNKELKRNNLDRFVNLSRRYFELYPNKKKAKKFFSGFMTICYAHTDINRLYKRYLKDSLDIDAFYHLMVKVDIIRETFKEILKIYGFNEEKVYGIKDSPKRNIIDFFVAIRSISIAHPQSTNRHQRFGFDGNVWLEDVRKKSDLGGVFPSNDSVENADFVLLLVRFENTDDLSDTKDEKMGINLEKDVFNVVKIIEESINILNDFLINKIKEKENLFKKKKINITNSLNDKDFQTLFYETKKRYPSLIEATNDKATYYWELTNVKELLYFVRNNFPDEEFEMLMCKVVNSYHRQLQEMTLRDEKRGIERLRGDLHNLLFPSLEILELKSGKDFYYCSSKIYEYLSHSSDVSAPEILNKSELYPYEWFAGIKKDSFGMNSSSAGWGIYNLMIVLESFPEFDFKYTNTDNTAYTDKELYFQFVIKVFQYNRKHKNDRDIIDRIK